MATTQSAPRRGSGWPSVDAIAWMVFVPALGGLGALIVAVLPLPLVLPALSLLMVLFGFALAGGLYVAGFRLEQGPAAAWNTAGALVFLGFAAALLTDVDGALAVLEQLETRVATAR